jgi:hypothetical protein
LIQLSTAGQTSKNPPVDDPLQRLLFHLFARFPRGQLDALQFCIEFVDRDILTINARDCLARRDAVFPLTASCQRQER